MPEPAPNIELVLIEGAIMTMGIEPGMRSVSSRTAWRERPIPTPTGALVFPLRGA
jgi:hypothetical protein